MAIWLQKQWKKSRTCPACGTDRIRKGDNYCMMCGLDLRKSKKEEIKKNGSFKSCSKH